MKTTDFTNKVKACLLGLLPIFTILPVFGQSQYQGTYLGYGYVRLEGAVTQPETPSGIAIAVVAADGSISLQNGDITGSVDDNGVITWDQPNNLFLNAGNIENAVLHGSGSSVSGAVTTFTRIELRSGGGLNAGDSLDDSIKLINPANALSDKIRVVHDGTRFVALGSKGTVSISEDGTNWETRAIGTPHGLRDIAYANGTWVVVGDANTVLTSTDLVNWVPRASGVGDIQQWPVVSVAFFNGRFYIANLIGAVVRSADGTGSAWDAPIIAGDASNGLGGALLRVLNGRLYLSGKRLFSSVAEMSFTTDGTNFTQCVIGGGGVISISFLAYGNGKYALSQGFFYAHSADGITFTRANSPVTFGFLGFDGARFIGRAQGTSSGSNGFRYSTDAVTWTAGTANSITAVLDVANAGGVIVGVGGTRSRKSTDGLVWQDITTGAIAPELAHTGFAPTAVYGNGIYLVSGVSGKNFLTRDGVTWSEAPAKRAVFGNGVFVARNEISLDGVNWTPVEMGLTAGETGLNDSVPIAFNGQSFLAATNAGRALVSSDGIVWTHANPASAIHSSSSGTLFGANGEWVRFGSNGFHSRSLDGGVTWTNHLLGSNSHVGVAYGNGRFVIAGAAIYAGNSLASMSAVATSFPASYSLENVAYVDGLFLVMETTTRQYFVSDGLPGSPWVPKSHAHFRAFSSVAEGPDFALMTGADSYVFRVDRVSVGHPVIASQPAALTTLGQDGTFQLSVTAIGNEPLTYRWYRNGQPLQNGGRVSGADTANLIISAISDSDAGAYSVVIRNAQGSAVSGAAVLVVAPKPQILSQPQSVTALRQATASFTIEVGPDTTGIRWFYNGMEIPGATSATLVIQDVSTANAGFYHAEVTNPGGILESNPAALSLSASGTPGLEITLDDTFIANMPELRPTQITFQHSTINSFLILDILVQPDGKVLVSGRFEYTNSGGQTRHSIVRLNANGSLDSGFNPPALQLDGFNGARHAALFEQMTRLSDGRIVVVGALHRVNGNSVTAHRAVMLNADGTHVATFLPSLPADSYSISVGVDEFDRIIIAGYRISGTSDANQRHIRRYTATTGALDGANYGLAPGHGEVTNKSVVVQADGKAVYAAYTTDFSAIRTYRVTVAGAIDTSFHSADFGNTWIDSIIPLPGGGFQANGSFTTVDGQPRIGMARFNSEGILEETFVPGGGLALAQHGLAVNAAFKGSASLGTGFVISGGRFVTSGAPATHNIGLFAPDGAFVENAGIGTGTDAGFAGRVGAVAAAADGTAAYFGGSFTTLNGQPVPKVVRLNASPIGGGEPLNLEILHASDSRAFGNGDQVVLLVAAAGGNLTFQWFQNDDPLPGETSMSLLLSSMTEANAGTYRVEVRDASGMVPSDDIILTYSATPSATFANWPDLAALPADQRGPNARPANDGVDNLVKFALGIPPLQSATARLPSEIVKGQGDDEAFPVVSFIRLKNLTGLTLQVEVCADLDFAEIIGTTHLGTEDLGDGTERVTVRSNATFASLTTQFFRLKVIKD